MCQVKTLVAGLPQVRSTRQNRISDDTAKACVFIYIYIYIYVYRHLIGAHTCFLSAILACSRAISKARARRIRQPKKTAARNPGKRSLSRGTSERYSYEEFTRLARDEAGSKYLKLH